MSSGRFLRYTIVGAGLCAFAWLVGLLLFVQNVSTLVEPPINDALTKTDAIIVLTGGSDRLATGLELLKAGKAQKLLVSGVHHGLTPEQLLTNLNVPSVLRSCCIILGHTAETTHGNARETRGWMAEQNFHSLRLVTANYHMQRSLMIFHNTMPDIDIMPHPVKPDSVKLDSWWDRPGTASLLVTEYNKLLWAYLLRDIRT